MNKMKNLFIKTRPLEGPISIEEGMNEGGLLTTIPGTKYVSLVVGKYKIPFMKPVIDYFYNPTSDEKRIMERNRNLDDLTRLKRSGNLIKIEGEVFPKRVGDIDLSRYVGEVLVEGKRIYHFDVDLKKSANESSFLRV